ncbi:MAG: carboxypeptidase-like regulatory domain-containing protein [Acidobacteriia bacterium]|nr:carboxypeptidase-like regulatory domain-containing protein [Terriglobia bacterium]
MKNGRHRTTIPGALILSAALLSLFCVAAGAQTKPVSGKVAGVVRDTAGTPQMGATVQIVPEGTGLASSAEYLTNMQGIFRGERFAPGLYTVRVTLAGYLPTVEQHVRVTAQLTTLVRIELESMFASLDRLRRQPATTSDADDWKWVLRSSAAMRPVLQWMDENGSAGQHGANGGTPELPHARLELTSGARRPGSISNLADAAGTAFAYEQRIGATGKLLLAGQMSYERAPAGGLAAIWRPTGSAETGPQTTLVLREARLGPDGPTFRGVRLDQSGLVALGDRVAVRYGAEYVLVGLGMAASSLRPRTEVDVRVNEDWRAALVFAGQPGVPSLASSGEEDRNAALVSVLDQLDTFPALLWRNGRPVLEGGWHEELSAQRKLGARGSLQIAAFHDDNRHVALFGRGSDLASENFLHDFFSNGLATDGGASSAWGTRLAVREKAGENTELTVVYGFAGALAPDEQPGAEFREALRTRQRHTLSADIKTRVPWLGTQVNAGYKWISGRILSRPDSFGETLFQNDPYLHINVRQALPKFAPGHWEALAECQNLLAQGYVPMSGRDGSVVVVPVFRSFRGGVSVQF